MEMTTPARSRPSPPRSIGTPRPRPAGAPAFRPLACLGLVLAALTSTHAAETPEWLARVPPPRAGDYPPLKPCKLTYRISWNGVIKAGETTIQYGLQDKKNPRATAGKAIGRSTGVARLLWPYDHTFRSVIDARSLRPIHFEATETERGERTSTWVDYFPDRILSRQEEILKDGSKQTRKHAIALPHAFDLLSSILYLRSLPNKKGDTASVIIHPFDSAYLVRFTVLGKEMHKTRLGNFECLKMDVKIQGIDRKTSKLKEYTRLKKATLWVPNDACRLPSEIRAKIFVGDIRATLINRQ